MSEDKDELLKQQNEEIQKLKKELKSATKPSSMLSVLKNSIKRNVHDFFVREDRMKTMDSKIKKLEKELEQKEDELNKTSAELFAAVNLGQPETEPETPPSSDTEKVDDADCRTETAPVFPQTAEEAILSRSTLDQSTLLNLQGTIILTLTRLHIAPQSHPQHH